MIGIRPYRVDELPLVVACSARAAVDQLVRRDLPGATHERVAGQVYRMYQNALLMPQATVLIADWPSGTGGEGVAGYALLMPQPNAFTGEKELVVMDIYTSPSLRGKGLGKAMLQRAFDYARAVGCGSLAAQVALHNQASLALFRSSGFEGERVVVGRRV